MQLMTIHEASSMAKKSIQTIRRMIKRKKIEVKKQKTPQGFNYLIVKASLEDFLADSNDYGHVMIEEQNRKHGILEDKNANLETSTIQTGFEETLRDQLEQFGTVMQKLIEQNQQDKSNFFQLIKTFQDRNAMLEDRIKMLEAPKSSWWQFWK